ncbi:MAG: hypothetical protein NZ742_07420 [Acidobacteria bacterium]|nr:hypothetical protein [Acidobacteriota bacterium]MDW7984648.1 hypothetical protein [Acidobacteriota bacterium]
MGHDRFRIAVVTPFLDKRHGTERRVAEEIERLARDYGYEIHVYSKLIEDIVIDTSPAPGDWGRKAFAPGLPMRVHLKWAPSGDTDPHRPAESLSRADAPTHGSSHPSPSRGPVPIVWYRIPDIPGPYLGRYLWWFVANHGWRWWHRWVRGYRYDLTYSPGVNCLDADVVSVHIVFAAFYQQVRRELAFPRNPLRFWPRLLHRRLYYRLIRILERWVYRRKSTYLLPVSQMVAKTA